MRVPTLFPYRVLWWALRGSHYPGFLRGSKFPTLLMQRK